MPLDPPPCLAAQPACVCVWWWEGGQVKELALHLSLALQQHEEETSLLSEPQSQPSFGERAEAPGQPPTTKRSPYVENSVQ